MNVLELFLSYIIGDFDNREQINEEIQAGKQIHPKAKHINRVVNDKMENIPAHFDGVFVLEESYYTQADGKQTSSPHLFLFYVNQEGKVCLKSYQLNKTEKKSLTNTNPSLGFDFEQIQPSQNFSDLEYHYDQHKGFSCDVTIDLGNNRAFRLAEQITNDALHVLEVFTINGKSLFLFDTPIIYKRIKKQPSA